jgi:hypothetical protein
MNFLTLACRDVDGMAQFFRALGWPEAPSSRDPEGNIWDVAWKYGSDVAPSGGLTWN